MKKHIRFLITLLGALCAFASVAQAAKSIDYFATIEKEAAPIAGEQYYMRHGLMYEGENWEATNYWRGTLLPINAKVTLVAMDKDSFTLKIESTGETLKIKNTKYTKKSIALIAKNMLTRTEVPVDRFDKDTAKKIMNGEMSKGMTKEQVIMARGYPPGSKTPSLEKDTWIYWTSRFVTNTIVFKDGVLAEGRNT